MEPVESSELGPEPELSDRLDETVVVLPCYEPAGTVVELTGRALCTHSLLLGQTGSGKTSVMRWFIKSLIFHHSGDSEHKPGVFIIDLNGDETVSLVCKWAKEAGREDDVRLLTPTEGHLDLFADIRGLGDLSFATSHFMHGPWVKNDHHNAYWADTARALIDAALGSHDFRSLLPNFGNHFFFRSTEALTGNFATAVMGTRLIETRAVQSEQYEKILLQAGETIVQIKAFISEFSVGRMKQIHEELAAARELETLAKAEAEQTSQQLEDYETQKEAIGGQKATLQTEVQKARGYPLAVTLLQSLPSRWRSIRPPAEPN